MTIIKSYFGKYWDIISDIIRSEVPKEYRTAFLQKLAIESELSKIDKLKKESPDQYTERVQKKVEKLNKEANKLDTQMKGMDSEKYERFTPLLAYAKYMEKGIRDGFTAEDLKKMAQYMEAGKNSLYLERIGEDPNREPYKKDAYLHTAINNVLGRMCHQEKVKIDKALATIGDKQMISADELYNRATVYKFQRNITLKEELESFSAHIHDAMNDLEAVDDNLHINSPSFRSMKNALIDLHKALRTDYKLEENEKELLDIGDKIEKLHKASLDYIKEKGIGNQYTIMGKARIYLGMALSTVTSDELMFLPSRERMKKCDEVLPYEEPLKEGEEPEIDEDGEEYGGPIVMGNLEELANFSK